MEPGAGFALLWAAPHTWTLPLRAVVTQPLPEGCSWVLAIHSTTPRRQALVASFYRLGIKKSRLKVS